MFQRGTGERFKYKQAVLEKFPVAKCKRSPIKTYNQHEYAHYLYAVYDGEKRISEAFKRAEDAWSDVWVKKIKK